MKIKSILLVLSMLVAFNVSAATQETNEDLIDSSHVSSIPKDRSGIASTLKVYQKGISSYYAQQFNGRLTASGKVFNMNAMTCAHRSLPFGTKLKVVNQKTGDSTILTVNDRGPYVGDRILDMSLAGAREIGCYKSGTCPVAISIVK